MLGVNVGAGEHEIRLKYSPEGFTNGVIISGSALTLLLMLIILEYVSKKKKKTVKAEAIAPADNITEEVSAPEVTDEKPESDDSIPRD